MLANGIPCVNSIFRVASCAKKEIAIPYTQNLIKNFISVLMRFRFFARTFGGGATTQICSMYTHLFSLCSSLYPANAARSQFCHHFLFHSAHHHYCTAKIFSFLCLFCETHSDREKERDTDFLRFFALCFYFCAPFVCVRFFSLYFLFSYLISESVLEVCILFNSLSSLYLSLKFCYFLHFVYIYVVSLPSSSLYCMFPNLLNNDDDDNDGSSK